MSAKVLMSTLEVKDAQGSTTQMERGALLQLHVAKVSNSLKYMSQSMANNKMSCALSKDSD